MGKRARRTIVEAPATPAPSLGPPSTAWTDRDPRYWPAVGVVMVLALGLRLYRLTTPIFQHDEAIYAVFSNNFDGYNFDPVYHGPTLYHILKFVYVVAGLFVSPGDNDWTARIVSVAMGMAVLGLLVGPARRWLGARGALGAALVLAISPVMVTYQRRILFDSWVMVLTLAAVLALQEAISARRKTLASSNAWVTLSVILTAFLATKANSFFVIAMLAGFWTLTWLRGLGPRNLIVKLPTQLPLILFMILSVTSVVCAPHETRNGRIVAAVGFASSLFLWEWLRRGAPARSAETGVPTAFAWPRPDAATIMSALAISGFLYAFLFGHGYRWAEEVYRAVKAPAHTAGSWDFVRQHADEVVKAMPKMLEYWGGQQKQPRLPGRHDFYLTLMLAYELPVLVLAVCGIYRASARRTRFTDLLLWWSFTSYTLYAVANEKVPWLMTHVVFPLALLGGWWLGQARVTRGVARAGFAAALALGAAYLFRNISATNYERALDHREPMFYAFTSESFRDTFLKALEVAREKPGDFWIYNAWPASWYMRHADLDFPGAAVHYTEQSPSTTQPLRLVVCQEQDWEVRQADGTMERKKEFVGYHKWVYDPVTDSVVKDGTGENPYILLWPRLSWTSLRPDKWARWFWTREASTDQPPDNSRDPFLTDWSHIPVVVATAP